jgi:hypothetical protein
MSYPRSPRCLTFNMIFMLFYPRDYCNLGLINLLFQCQKSFRTAYRRYQVGCSVECRGLSASLQRSSETVRKKADRLIVRSLLQNLVPSLCSADRIDPLATLAPRLRSVFRQILAHSQQRQCIVQCLRFLKYNTKPAPAKMMTTLEAAATGTTGKG